MDKKIWVINHNAQPPSLGGLCRHYYFKKNIDRNQYDVKIITSSVIHNTKIDMLENSDKVLETKVVDGEEFVFLKTNTYAGNSLKRKFNFLSFAFKLKKLPKLLGEKPDLIYTSSPDIFAAFYAVKLAKKIKVPCVVEIRDLWPESIIEYGDFSPRHPFIKIMYMMEKWIYKNATSIVFTTEGERQYLIDRGWQKSISLDKCYYINNGVELDSLEEKKQNFVYKDEILNNSNIFKCVYVGSIRKANNIKLIAECAQAMKEKKDIHFLFFGDGNEKQEIEDFCKEAEISNCHFYGHVDSKYIPYICANADINILNYKKAKTLKYGGSQNKLFDYLASGKPIISTVPMNYNLIERANCGITLENYGAKELADAILQIYSLTNEEREEMGIRGIEIAKEFDFKILAERFLYVIEKSLGIESEREYKVYEGEKING